MFLRHVACLLLITLSVSCASQSDQEPNGLPDIHSELIHSDLPLFDANRENVWPQPFFSEDSVGCASRIRFGDWALLNQDGDLEDWYRFSNYGVLHCWALVGHAYEREELNDAASEPSLFIRLGTSIGRELWAIQIGARPGSDYILLSRAINDEGIAEFEVMQTKCPNANVRDAGSLDILLTRYCAINNRSDLMRLARRMVKLPPRGTLLMVEKDELISP